jgi:enamine deaminase RidA (YjgF/YER057c/UK114 family)
MPASPSQGLARLGLTLPPPPTPAGAYVPAVQEGNLLWVSGQGPFRDGAVLHPGRVESKVSVEEAQECARVAALQGLSAAASVAGSIDRIRRIVRVGVFVASDPRFTRQHEVANGASELLLGIFGETGRASRVSVGVPALPLNFPVEVELLVATW